MTNALLTCVTCNNIFRSRTELTYHVKRHHQSSVKIKFGNGHVTEVKKGEDGMFKCMCEKRFKAPTSLRQHAKNCNVELAESEHAQSEDVEMLETMSDASGSADHDDAYISDNPVDCVGGLISYGKC
jgi:uncharacterized C2H2 Zn-finger protein